MTPINEMTNEQLDRWIAERREKRPSDELLIKGGMDGNTSKYWGVKAITDIDTMRRTSVTTLEWIPVPFTTDPRYAFELLEEMGEGVALEHSAFYHKWAIGLVDDDNYFVTAATPCRAICEAWAEWRGDE